tara:strand:+ start:4172 stop:6907 length:2736 start_codon:yes stop_codon:yes gene_type:complete
VFGVFGCGDTVEDVSILLEGKADVLVVYAEDAKPGIREAAEEAVRALSAMTGVTFAAPRKVSRGSSISDASESVILLLGHGVLGDEPAKEEDLKELGEEGYLRWGRSVGGKKVFQIAANAPVGVQYGLYDLLRKMGVRYFHPANTYTPTNRKDLTLHMGEKMVSTPFYALRGFHHHTQHPIPMSVYLLEPDEKHLPRVREYVRWLVRNRQNLLQWHMLKTVDMKAWIPYMQKVKTLVDEYGIKLGLTISFADQQQNNFKLLENVQASDDEQKKEIESGLEELLKGGFSVIVVQFGTSEFTKVKDEQALMWLNTASKYLTAKGVENYAWVHIEGALKADDETSYYFHLPEKADKTLGSYLHTTMFYDMKNPAPVYSNKNFNHQADYLNRVNGKRKVVYFPESAWWLGFDNNLPLALPITGYSRALDVLDIMKGKEVSGHVTFTSGMEWGYWKYDHHLTRLTWDGKTDWAAYSKDFASIFGEHASKVDNAIQALTTLQVNKLYKENPELMFYIAGELPQDEIGQQAGIYARRPKRAFPEIMDLPVADFATWEKEDFARLEEMRDEAKKILDTLSADATFDNPVASKLYLELYSTYKLFWMRTQHAHLLYDAVRLMRKGRTDGGVGADPDKATREQALKDADKKIKEAMAITQEVLTIVKKIEKEVYRYPLEIVATKRSSLTSFPFGYLWETSTAFFWSRRDEQAELLWKKASGLLKEGWNEPLPAVSFRVDSKDLEAVKPDNGTIKNVISSFIPGLMLGLPETKVADGVLSKPWRMGTDHNDNDKSDIGADSPFDQTEIVTEGGKTYAVSKSKLYKMLVFNDTGAQLGSLGLQSLEIKVEITRSSDTIKEVKEGTLTCEIVLENLIAIATQVSGIERDGLLQLLGQLLGFDPKNPPPSLALELRLKVFSKIGG